MSISVRSGIPQLNVASAGSVPLVIHIVLNTPYPEPHAVAVALAELRRVYPAMKFQLIPYRYIGRLFGAGPRLMEILAVEQ